jgi:ABC-type lipoprotein export system ATPase subunit
VILACPDRVREIERSGVARWRAAQLVNVEFVQRSEQATAINPQIDQWPEPASRGVAVEVHNVVKSFGPIKALRGVSMSVAASEFVTITGPSGSGKSTLLNLIGSLARPDSGSVTVAGAPVPAPRYAVDFRRHMVGFMFQEHLLLPYLSAQANIEAALLATGVRLRDRAPRALKLLEEVGLADRAGHLPSELSGGQRHGVALARALANGPRLLLADEPTGALDSKSGARALELLASTRSRHGMTVIVVSHDTAAAERADRVVQLTDGRVVEAGG